MGTIIESCRKCSQNKEENEKEEYRTNTLPSPILETKKIENELDDKYSKGKITIITQEDSPNNSEKDKIRKEFLFQSQFHKDPFEYYEIIKEISPDKKIVNFINNPNVPLRLMKIIDRSDIGDSEYKKKLFLDEIKNLQLLDNPNIEKILEIFVHKNNFFLICDYNDEHNKFLTKIKNCGIDESGIKKIMDKILNSVDFLHQSEIFNIELKLDDLTIIEMTLKSQKKRILKKKNPDVADNQSNNQIIRKTYDIKLLDLGYLNINYNSTDINSLKYYSPEIIEQIENNDLKKDFTDTDDKSDEWSCGIIMYYLACGQFPFEGESEEEIMKKIKENSPDFSSSKFDDISDSCKDLICKLLEKDKNKRLRCKDCFIHPFFTGEAFTKEEEKVEIDKEILKDLLSIQKPKSKFHELMIAYMCFHFLDKEEEAKIKDIFNYIDQDHNNIISEEDIINAFIKNDIQYTDKDIEKILYVFDYDKNNLIQYQEFLRVLCNKDNLFNENNLEATFNAIDTDNNKFIDGKDIQEFIPHDEKTMNKVEKEFMEPFGMKSDDKITYKQFREIIVNDKTFAEVNNFKSRLEKIRMKGLLDLAQKENEKKDEE